MYCQRWFFALVLAGGLVGAPANASQFERPVFYGVGQKPTVTVAARLSNSGNIDLAVALSDEVSILLGNGDGTFQKPLTFPVPSPLGIAVGDFNEDGNQDLAIVEYGGTGVGYLAIFLGDGEGHFTPSASYKMGVGTVRVAAADFNKDGHLDLAVANEGFEGSGESMMTLFGDGSGHFSGRKTYKMQPDEYPFGIAAGDLNGDGYPDIAVATAEGGSVAVFMNDGTGRFGVPTYYRLDGEPLQVTIADLRNDGRGDLVVADGVYALDVWLNNGDGTFGSPSQYLPKFPDAEPPEACTVADFNLDGKLDVACAGPYSYAYWFRRQRGWHVHVRH